jgi:hypothetical protein
VRVAAPLQLPPAQRGEVQSRACEPLVPHGSVNPLHPLQPPHESAPQGVPSVVREQPVVSVRATGVHAPPMHVESVHVRDAVPLVAHVSAPLHAPKLPHDVGAHEAPVVSRKQSCVLVASVGMHRVLTQWNVLTICDCVPVFVHVSAKPPHAPKPPIIGAGHDASFVQPVQTSAVSSQSVVPMHGLPPWSEQEPEPQ